MFRMMLIPDTNRFLDMVKTSSGSVFLHLSDDRQVDLKNDSTAQQMFRFINPGKEGLLFSLSNPSDMPAFFHYMAEYARC